jgi:hypothetical protein
MIATQVCRSKEKEIEPFGAKWCEALTIKGWVGSRTLGPDRLEGAGVADEVPPPVAPIPVHVQQADVLAHGQGR